MAVEDLVFVNFAEGPLLSGVGVADTTLIVEESATYPFPSPIAPQYSVITLFDGINPPEIAHITVNNGGGSLTVERAQEGTSARAWGAGTRVRHVLTAAQIDLIRGSGEGAVASEAFNTKAEWQAANVPAAVDAFITSGFGAHGDGGSALYKRIGAEPAHAGKFQSADGAWWELSEPEVNAKMFGAAFDGVTLDTAAWLDLVSYVTATGAVVSVPEGHSLIGDQLSFGPTTIRGAGAGKSILEWPNGSANAGLAVTHTDREEISAVFGLSLYAGAAGTTVGGHNGFNALAYSASGVSMNTALVMSLSLEDLEIRGAGDKFDVCWSQGLRIFEPRSVSIRNVNIRGSFASTDFTTMFGTGIRIMGSTNPINVKISHYQINRCNFGVDVTECEGTYLNHGEMVGCNIGFRYRTNTAGVKQPQINIGVGTHFNCYDFNIDCKDLAQSTIEECNFMRRPDAVGANFSHIRLVDCSFIQIGACNFFDDIQANPSYGIEMRGCYACVVQPNVFQYGHTCILIDTNSQNITVDYQRVERAFYTNFLTNVGDHVELPCATRHVKRTGTQSIPNNTYTAITWQSGVDGNQDDVWSAGAAPARFTCKNAGWHIITVELIWDANATGYREIRLFDSLAGTALIETMRARIPGSADHVQYLSHVSEPIYLNRGDTVDIRALQNSGGALNVQAESRASFTWVGP